MADSLDPFINVAGSVRECWRCGHTLTHEDDHLADCPVCSDERLVPFGTRFSLVADFLY